MDDDASPPTPYAVQDAAEYRSAIASIIVICQVAAFTFVIAGSVLLIFGPAGLYWIVAATLLSFLAACTDARGSLIEMNHEGL